jgi:hypothetical protein
MYNHCLNRYRSTSHWIFNLDTDEVVDGVPGARLGRAAQREHLANETAVELQTIAHTGPSVGTWVADAHLLRQAGPITTDWHRPGQEKRAKFPTSKAPISADFHSFRLIFGRAIISRNGLEAWMLFPERARAEHSC